MDSNNQPIILVDGSSYLFRAFHALPPLTNSQGEPTGAIYGVVNMLRRLIKDYQPIYMAVIFDTKEKTFRHTLYPAYKANRPEMSDELRVQIEPLHQLIRAMGLPVVAVPGVEADDVIGTLSERLGKTHSILVSTGDKDMAQLVNDKVTLVNTMNDSRLDPEGVEKKFGIRPDQIIDYFALVGDSVDNIPGVPKVGPKTAAKWLTQYETLANVIAHADEIKGKVGESLRTHLERLECARELVTIKKDVELSLSLDDLKCQPADNDTLITLLTRFEFQRWLRDAQEAGVSATRSSVDKRDYVTVLDASTWAFWLDKLKSADCFAFDTETTCLDSMSAQLVGFSVSVKAGEAAYVPLKHSYAGAPEQMPFDKTLADIKAILKDKAKTIIGQNLKYDLNVLSHYGIAPQTRIYDTLLESYVLDSTRTRHDMNTLALKYLGRKTIHYEEVAGKGRNQVSFDKVHLEQATAYAAEDADIALQLHEQLYPRINDQPGALQTLNDIEWPLVSVLARVEQNGVLVDRDLLEQQSQELAGALEALEEKAYALAGSVFNLSSPQQLQTVLYNQMGLPVLSKTPKGAPSTAEDVLRTLALDYPLPDVILQHRSLSKLKSTYTDRLPKDINPRTGRVHTSYNQAVTATGRLSSTHPNLQNIPARTPEGRRIRQAFIAPQGYCIVSADYSQIELRIMAHLTQDEGLLNAFAQGLDIHRATAAEVFSVTMDAVTAEQRRRAKAINFGLIYGMSEFGLAKQLGIDRATAKHYIDVYFLRYPGIKEYMEAIRQHAHETKYVSTIFGRRLYLPEINARNLQRQRAAERAAINAPMQGSAAEIIKVAMIDIDRYLQDTSLDAKMLMQVHDELVFEVSVQDAKVLAQKVSELMSKAADLSVSLDVNVGIGDNWDQAHR